jgi:hypothetical protein
VCIELKNHKTGLRERIEGHNDVTNALQTAINHYTLIGRTSYMGPVVTSLMGGLILIDKELSGSDVYIPGDAKIIGSGFQGSNTESTIVGTYNSTESGLDSSQRIYTHVWDFATSQANGLIKALGLTTSLGGQYPHTIGTLYRTSVESNCYIIYLDEENNDLYYCTGYGSAQPILKAHFNFKDLMLHCIYNELNGVDTGKTINASSNFGNFPIIDGHDGYVYAIASISSNRVTIRNWKVSDLSFEQGTDRIISFAGVPYTSLSTTGFNINGDLGYFYIASANNQYVYRYDLNNNLITTYDLSSVGFITSSNSIVIVSAKNGDIYCQSDASTKKAIRISSDGVISTQDTHSSSIWAIRGTTLLDNGIMYGGGNSYAFCSNSLMTNFNLQTPVEKTVAKSMKVIYTLTQE